MPDHVATPSSIGNNWMSCYRAIYVCNAVLQSLEANGFAGDGANFIRGQALALRAARYLDAVQVWCLAYDPATAGTTLGLPLRLDPDMNVPSVRASLQETYARILDDLQKAAPLLPEKQASRMRMSRDAVYGLLARAYLFMGDYNRSLEFSLKALSITDTLMDFSTLDPEAEYPIR